MPPRIKYLVFASLLAGSSVASMPAHTVPAADECLSGPDRSVPDGSQWFYRIDRANNNRKCWYLGDKVRTARHRMPATQSVKGEPRVPPAADQPIASAVVAGAPPGPAQQPQIDAQGFGPLANLGAMLWPNPVLAVGPAMVAAAEGPVAASSPVSEPDGDSVRAKSEPEPVPPAPAPVIDLRLMGALLIVALVLAGIVGRLTYLHFAERPTRRTGLRMQPDQCARSGRRPVPHPSIVQILAKAPSPSYRDQAVPESKREGDHWARAEPVYAVKQLEPRVDHAEPVDPLEQLELLLQEIDQRAHRSAA
jgi:hypothetical protein